MHFIWIIANIEHRIYICLLKLNDYLPDNFFAKYKLCGFRHKYNDILANSPSLSRQALKHKHSESESCTSGDTKHFQ